MTERSAQAGSYGPRGPVYSTEEEWRGSEFSMHYEVRLSANGESIGFMGRIEKESKFTRKYNRIAASAMCPFRFVRPVWHYWRFFFCWIQWQVQWRVGVLLVISQRKGGGDRPWSLKLGKEEVEILSRCSEGRTCNGH